MAQVFARITKSPVSSKVGTCDWFGLPQLRLDKGLVPIDPDCEEAKAEVEKVLSNVPGIALAPIDGKPPHVFDIRNPFKSERGMLFLDRREGQPARNVRWDFRERLIDIWEGRNGFILPQRKDTLWGFMDYQLNLGGNRPSLMEYLGTVAEEEWHRDKIPGEIILAQRDFTAPKIDKALADEIVAYLKAAELRPTDAELSQLAGMRWVLVKYVRERNFGPGQLRPYPVHGIKLGEVGMEEVSTVKTMRERYQFVSANSEEARGKIERMEKRNPGLKLTPIDGSPSHPLDVRNPYRTFNDGRLFAEVNGSSGGWNFLNRLRHEAAQLATRATNVDALLDHHLGGSNPEAFVEFIRGEVLTWKSGRGLHPRSLQGWLAANGMLNDNAVTADPWLVDRCERWLEEVRKAPALVKGGTSAKDGPKRPTLVDKLGEVEDATKRFMDLVRVAGLCDASGRWIAESDAKGKSKLIAAWDAVVEVLKVPDFDTNKALAKALKDHFKGLEGLEALHKVRKRPLYTDHLEKYATELFGN